MYKKLFGHQTTTNISPGRNVPHLTGEMVILVPKKNQYPFLNKKNLVENFTQYSPNFYAVFGLKKFKWQINKTCVVNPVVTFHFLMMICSIS